MKNKKIILAVLSLIMVFSMAFGTSAATDYAQNGNCTTDDVSGWAWWLEDDGAKSSFTVVKNGGPDGSDCFSLKAESVKHYFVFNHLTAADHKFVGGKTYTITVCVKGLGDLEGGALMVQPFGGDDQGYIFSPDRGGDTNFEGKLNGNFDWKVINFKFTLPANTNNAKVGLAIWDGAGELQFDNFMITEGETPAYTELPKKGGSGDNNKPNPGTGDLALAIVPVAVISLAGAVIIGKRKRG